MDRPGRCEENTKRWRMEMTDQDPKNITNSKTNKEKIDNAENQKKQKKSTFVTPTSGTLSIIESEKQTRFYSDSVNLTYVHSPEPPLREGLKFALNLNWSAKIVHHPVRSLQNQLFQPGRSGSSGRSVQKIDHIIPYDPAIVRGFGIPLVVKFEDCCKWLEFSALHNSLLVNLCCKVVFLSWKDRNKFIHGGTKESSVLIAANAISFSSVSKISFVFSTGNWDANQSIRLSNLWHPPPPDWLKVNVDASLCPSYKAGIAGVLLAYGKSCIHWDASQLELVAIQSLKEVIKDWMFKYKGLIIEGDNYNIMRYLQGTLNKGLHEMEDLAFIKEFNHVIFNCIGRNCNKIQKGIIKWNNDERIPKVFNK
ncbi:hypothetical protein IEQ34_011064 [Dendrobium chrysotoxum]|uniref:RNase H type-1 domain-containing protein n=1 Tax=Dendrobium chrysotoxum TaxID=161865 RepID=A0AAV7GWI7_DENCH|nr:hypothetical protein IEQ34_011064 [Dendrobium chrysotoxum]